MGEDQARNEKQEFLPCPFCVYVEELSEEDPDASFSQILSHIRWQHPGENQEPTVLWRKIEVI